MHRRSSPRWFPHFVEWKLITNNSSFIILTVYKSIIFKKCEKNLFLLEDLNKLCEKLWIQEGIVELFRVRSTDIVEYIFSKDTPSLNWKVLLIPFLLKF